MSNTLGWGILGTGRIAGVLADAIARSTTGKLVAVGSRQQQAADQFSQRYKIPNNYGSYSAVLDDPQVQAVYISLPNHLHAEWAIRCAQAGKAILLEKPFALNTAQATSVMEAVRRHNVFLMEAFMYRCHPQTARLAQLIREKAIGEVRIIQSTFSYNLGPKYDNIRLTNSAGGGAIMDVGCYTLSMSRLIAGAATGGDFAEPVDFKAVAHIGSRSRVDELATASLKFPGDIVASLTCGSQAHTDWTVRIWGSGGHMLVPNPWFPGRGDDESAVIQLQRSGQDKPEPISVPSDEPLYTIEVDTVAKHLHEKQAPSPCMTWADSLGNMRGLDRWRHEVGLRFDGE